MNIRLEKTEDYHEVENLTREAFWNVYRPGCTEHYVLNQYRTNPDFIPELDFVMERLRERLRVGDGTSGMGASAGMQARPKVKEAQARMGS